MQSNSIIQRFKRAWNVFTSRSPTPPAAVGSYYRPDRRRLTYGNQKSIVAAIYNQIAVDCMNIDVRHVTTDENGRFREEITDPLNECLKLSANIDQTGRDLIQDIVLSLEDEGVVAVIPVDYDSTNIYSLRVGKIVQWYPTQVRVELYNENTGKKQEVVVSKAHAAIISNPLYAVMNEPNGTARRLARKLALLDNSDENDYGKIDLLVQVPYTVKNPTKKAYADQRVKDIELQLTGSRYGIAYVDATEKVTQLNRSLDNHLLDQIKQLQSDLYAQLGLTEAVFNGTADEATMLNYYNRTVEPIMNAIVEEMTRKFLSKNARTRGQKIMYFRDPFKLVPVDKIADIADKFTRNAILSSNELRGIVGFKPVDDIKADELSNKNLNEQEGQVNPVVGQGGQNGEDEQTSTEFQPQTQQALPDKQQQLEELLEAMYG